MNHYFELPVFYKDEELSFKGRLETFGYVYKIYVVVNGQELIFEKDEELNYRVINHSSNAQKEGIDKELIEVIIETLQSRDAVQQNK